MYRHITEEDSSGVREYLPSPWRTEDGVPGDCYSRCVGFGATQVRREMSSPWATALGEGPGGLYGRMRRLREGKQFGGGPS